MDARMLLSIVLIGCIAKGTETLPQALTNHQLPQDAIIPPKPPTDVASPRAEFKYLWLAEDGSVFNDTATGRLEVAATLAITANEHQVGTYIVKQMTQHMPPEVFTQLASRASVGLFTFDDKTTIFPEYEHLKDRPECEGTCAGACSDTCTGDGRKYDSLAGVGGIRATCLDDNFMCTAADPYFQQYSVLVHEFGHTIHQYGLTGVSDYYGRISDAYQNARSNQIWDLSSYAMSNELEYFAEGTGVFFNTNRHPSSSGGMNSCGRPPGQFCATEGEGRDWLETMDPQLFDALSFTFTNHQPTLPGGLEVCVVL